MLLSLTSLVPLLFFALTSRIDSFKFSSVLLTKVKSLFLIVSSLFSSMLEDSFSCSFVSSIVSVSSFVFSSSVLIWFSFSKSSFLITLASKISSFFSSSFSIISSFLGSIISTFSIISFLLSFDFNSLISLLSGAIEASLISTISCFSSKKLAEVPSFLLSLLIESLFSISFDSNPCFLSLLIHLIKEAR